MSTLLLRLAAPLQSWGIDKFERRGTEAFPTKSGVIGLVAAALGRSRVDSLDDLQALRFGARADKPGSLLRDFHTARHPDDPKRAYVTYRFYLADAVFLAGLEGGDQLLDVIDEALRAPAYPLYLGRRSCPPEGQLSLGVRRGVSLLDALGDEPWLSVWTKAKGDAVRLRIVADAESQDNSAFLQRDMPISFNQNRRSYGFRKVKEYAPYVLHRQTGQDVGTSHDPMSAFEEG